MQRGAVLLGAATGAAARSSVRAAAAVAGASAVAAVALASSSSSSSSAAATPTAQSATPSVALAAAATRAATALAVGSRVTASAASAPPVAFSEAEIEEAVQALGDGWSTQLPERAAIKKTFVFKDFVEAHGWMASVALVAEKADHHPEWFNVYNRVEVVLATHDCQGVSIKDLALAKKMDELYNSKSR